MTERDELIASPEDARLDRHLLTLQRFAPKHGLEDRVLARIRLPSTVLVRIRERIQSIATPRRVWWASGLAAASSTAWLVALANWFSGGGLQTAAASFSAEVAQPAWVGALQLMTAGAKVLVSYALGSYATLGNGVFPVAAAVMVLPVLSSWGLYFTTHQTSGKRITAHAVR